MPGYPFDDNDIVHYKRQDHFLVDDIALNTLNGSLITLNGSPIGPSPFLDIKMIGGEQGTDISGLVQNTLDGFTEGGTLYYSGGGWVQNTEISIDNSNVSILLAPNATIDGSALPLEANLFQATGSVGITTTCVGATVVKYSRILTVVSTTGFAVGDYVQMLSTQDWDITRGVGEYCFSEWNRVAVVTDATHLQLEKPVAYTWDNAGHPVSVQKINAVENVSVSGGNFILGGAGLLHTAIRFLYCVDAKALGTNINYSENVGISFQRCYGGIAAENTIKHTDDETTGYGIMSQGSEDIIIAHNRGSYNRRSFEANGGTNGISRNVLIVDNIARNDRTTGVGSHAGTDFVVMARNIIEGCGGGIISRGANAVVDDNTIRNCQDGTTLALPSDISYQDGITVGSEGVGVFLAEIGQCVAGINPKVRRNRVSGSNRYAIYVRGCDTKNMDIANNTLDGRILYGGSQAEFVAYNTRIYDNDITATLTAGTRDAYGLYFRHKFFDLAIKRNTFRFTSLAGARIEGSADTANRNKGLVIADNECFDSTLYAIDVATSRVEGSRMYNNYARDCLDPDPFRGFNSDAAHLRGIAYDNFTDTAVTTRGIVSYRTAIPNAGTWNAGDIILNSLRTEGQPFGWTCVLAGTPGTWEQLGGVGASLNGSSSATVTLSLLDLYRRVAPVRATAQTLSIPLNSVVAFPVGTIIPISQGGVGQLTVVPIGGVTLNSKGGRTRLNGQWAKAVLTKTATDTWMLDGEITTLTTIPTYTETNVTPDRAYDASTVAIGELANVVGALIQDLRAGGLIS